MKSDDFSDMSPKIRRLLADLPSHLLRWNLIICVIILLSLVVAAVFMPTHYIDKFLNSI